VDLAFRKKLLGGHRWACDPVDILDGIKPNIGRHGGQEHMRGRPEALPPYVPALEIRDAANAFVSEQLEAAGVHACEDRYRVSSVDRNHQRRCEIQTEIDFPARKRS